MIFVKIKCLAVDGVIVPWTYKKGSAIPSKEL